MSSDDARRFGFPYYRYHGKGGLYEITLYNNMIEYANEITIITNLVAGGKLTPEEGYKRMKPLWKSFRKSRKKLQRSIDNGRGSA